MSDHDLTMHLDSGWWANAHSQMQSPLLSVLQFQLIVMDFSLMRQVSIAQSDMKLLDRLLVGVNAVGNSAL